MSVAASELSAELIDVLTEAVTRPSEPSVRADVICQILENLTDAVVWRQGGEPDTIERSSLALVLAAADEHRERMRRFTGR